MRSTTPSTGPRVADVLAALDSVRDPFDAALTAAARLWLTR